MVLYCLIFVYGPFTIGTIYVTPWWQNCNYIPSIHFQNSSMYKQISKQLLLEFPLYFLFMMIRRIHVIGQMLGHTFIMWVQNAETFLLLYR